MLDHAKPVRQQFIASCPAESGPFESAVLNERRRRAIEWMGKNWLLHPAYKPNPRHSPLNRGNLDLPRRLAAGMKAPDVARPVNRDATVNE